MRQKATPPGANRWASQTRFNIQRRAKSWAGQGKGDACSHLPRLSEKLGDVTFLAFWWAHQRLLTNFCCCLVTQSCPTLQPHGLWPASLLCPGDFPGNTGVGCHALLQGIFLTQGSNLGLLCCRQILSHPSHQCSRRLRYSSGKKKKADIPVGGGAPAAHLQEVTLPCHTVICVNGDLRPCAVRSLCNRTQLSPSEETDTGKYSTHHARWWERRREEGRACRAGAGLGRAWPGAGSLRRWQY